MIDLHINRTCCNSPCSLSLLTPTNFSPSFSGATGDKRSIRLRPDIICRGKATPSFDVSKLGCVPKLTYRTSHPHTCHGATETLATRTVLPYQTPLLPDKWHHTTIYVQEQQTLKNVEKALNHMANNCMTQFHRLSRARRNLTTTGIVLSNKRFFEQRDGVKKAGVLHTLLQLLACAQEVGLHRFVV